MPPVQPTNEKPTPTLKMEPQTKSVGEASASPADSPEMREEEHIPIKSLRTYQGDVEEAMLKNKYSATSILVAEQVRKEKAPRLETPVVTEGRNKLFITIGLSVVFLGLLMVGGVYYFRSTEEVVVEQQTKALIAFSLEKSFSVASSTRESFVSKIVSEKQTLKLPVNSVLYLNLTSNETESANITRVLSLLAPKMPASLSRSFENKYMLGIYSYSTNAPFIILTTSDFGSSFSGMLRWEKDAVSDLGKIFDIETSLGTTTRAFTDKALRNKDLRVLQDASGKTVLLYSFIDKNTLVITVNEDVFNAILAKYLTSKSVR